ncbi:TetR/AcrR family transcriptional regulator [Pseudonocardia acaciae]|uniref:TetR/AcrR family transcriptional regulator n=1 Tax=Pseudonocardia acaciae TaxID=551276 RepID=UPI00056D969D|nr:TetR/AcrR family transcriptional regulator [Pseudonocardia acaciae]
MPTPGPSAPAPAGRSRDPERRERILLSATELIADRGYHAVTMADIGSAAGIVGSGIYRHFDGKLAVLVALLDRVMERLLAEAYAAVAAARDDRQALGALVLGQIDVILEDGPLVLLYQRELLTLPEPDRRRLRRMQRHYIEEWVHVLVGLRPGLSDVAARVAVHAAIGAIQSVAHFRSGLPRAELTELLVAAAHAVLGVPEPWSEPAITRLTRRRG